MRSDSESFQQYNDAIDKEPRYTIEIAFDTAATDLVYFTSHTDGEYPSTSPVATVYANVVFGVSGTSQSLDPIKANASIGSLTVDILDKSSQITTLINTKLGSDKGLRGKRIRVYYGFEGQVWADYILVQTQIIRDSISYKDGVYSFKCEDIQRETKKDIFDINETYLTQSVAIGDTTINVASTSGFSLVEHGTSYSDAPSAEVLYIKINDEIIRCSGKTDTTFIVDTSTSPIGRGALNTLAAEHITGLDQSPITTDRPAPVKEYVYLEMPAIKLAYAILTGALYGQAGKELPSGWHLSIDASYITQSDFTGMTDLWDTSDDTAGFVLRFEGLKKQDGKKFLEEQLYLLCGAFSPIYADGTLGLKRMVQVLENSAYVETLSNENVKTYSELTHDLNGVYNNFIIDWNWDVLRDDYIRRTSIIDSTSITRHGKANALTWKFRGLHGSRHTNNVIKSIVERARDRYAGPPKKLRLETFHSLNKLEGGDPVRATLDSVRDFTGESSTLDSTFEVQRISIDWMRGCSVDLFGSSERATPLTYGDAVALNDSAYTASGTSLVAYLSAYSPVNYTASGGLLTITGNVTISGGTTLAAGRYYYDGDVQINSGVTVTFTHNLYLWVKGEFTNNGAIDGAGNGISGAAAETLPSGGYFGVTNSGGGIDIWIKDTGGVYFKSVPGGKVEGKATLDKISVTTDGTDIFGLPSDLRGVAGAGGWNLDLVQDDVPPDNSGVKATGGAGGDSGASLCVVCRGMSEGVSATYNLSGGNGSLGGYDANYDAYAGTGAGGAPGAMLIILDGGSSNVPTVIGKLTANSGTSQTQGDRLPQSSKSKYVFPVGDHSWYEGYPQRNYADSAYRYLFIPEQETAEEDPNPVKPVAPSSLSATSELKRNKDGTVIVGAHLTWIASTDPNVGYYLLDYKNDTDALGYEPAIQVQGRSTAETYVWNLSDTKQYTFRLRAINKFGFESSSITYSVTIDAKSAAPATPTGGSASTGIEKVILSIDAADMPTDADLAAIEYWYSTTNDRNTSPEPGRVTVAAVPGKKWGAEFKATVGTAVYVWFRSVDSSGNYSSSFYPSGATSGLSATPKFATPAQVSGLETGFRETWENDLALDDWTNYSGSGELSIVSVSDSQAGGKILRVGDNSGDDLAVLIYDYNIPFDSTKLYKLTIRVRRTAGTGPVYAGWAGIAADGSTLVNTAGSNAYSGQHYHCIDNGSPGSSWVEYVGYTKGYSAGSGTGVQGTLSSPGQMHPDVRYIRPDIVANSGAVAGTTEIDAFIIEEVPIAVRYSDDGTPVDDLKPAEIGADETGAHGNETWSDDFVLDGDMEYADTSYWGYGTATVAKDGGNAKYGIYGLSVSTGFKFNTLKGETSVAGSVYIPVESGDKLFCTGWAKTSTGAGTARLAINWYDGSKTYISTVYPATTTSSTYTQISGTATAVSSARYAIFHFVASTETCYFDAVSCRKTKVGADVTQTAIETGIDTTTGYIQHGSAFKYDLANYTFSIGSSTFRDPGIQLIWDVNESPNVAKAYFGDGADSFVEINTAVGLQVSGEIFTSGTFLTSAASAAATTLNVGNTSSFSASGSGYIIDSTNNHDAFSWTGKTATTLTGCSGVLAHNAGAIVIEGDSIIMSKKNNRQYFYGDAGGGDELLATIGVETSLGADSVARFGSLTSGNGQIGVIGRSYSAIGVSGKSVGSQGVYGYSTNSIGVLGISVTAIGITAQTLGTTDGAFQILPKSNTTDPTNTVKGTFYVRSDGVLRFCDGTSWRTVNVT